MDSISIYKIPDWLDRYIYDTLGATYCKQNENMTVIDWDKSKILNYLGTYFPRSYVEARCIINSTILSKLKAKEELSIFDFGCGTGGEIIGLLTNIEEFLPNVKSIRLIAFDGNYDALKLFEKVLSEYNKTSKLTISYRIAPIRIADFYDLSILDDLIKGPFDLILSFKAICEFVTIDQFKGANPYTHIIQTYIPHLSKDGLMILVDVTLYNNVSHEWLPKMIDKGLSKTNSIVIDRNEGYNQTFCINHSRIDPGYDTSKVCWRILEKK